MVMNGWFDDGYPLLNIQKANWKPWPSRKFVDLPMFIAWWIFPVRFLYVNHHFSWENPRTKSPFSIGFLYVYQAGYSWVLPHNRSQTCWTSFPSHPAELPTTKVGNWPPARGVQIGTCRWNIPENKWKNILGI